MRGVRTHRRWAPARPGSPPGLLCSLPALPRSPNTWALTRLWLPFASPGATYLSVGGAAGRRAWPWSQTDLGSELSSATSWPSSLTCLCSASSPVKSRTSVQFLWLLRGLNNILRLDLTRHYFLLFRVTLEFLVLPWFPDHLLDSLWRLIPAGLAGVRTPAQHSPQ